LVLARNNGIENLAHILDKENRLLMKVEPYCSVTPKNIKQVCQKVYFSLKNTIIFSRCLEEIPVDVFNGGVLFFLS